jgi:tetraacyldisaccharide 4'-kinase
VAHASLAERVWWGEGAAASLSRALLRPVEALYAGGVALRGALYDRGLIATHAMALPTVSVGNLSVGGTGKTPVAAWIARSLADRGARPAIVLRGYGGDETLVHRALNPDVPVVPAADRVAGGIEARRLGCDVVVLDDGFQHRRARRIADIVLVSAEQWRRSRRLLPAGPLRESPRALRRASLVLVTRKSASREAAEEVAAALAPYAGRPGVVRLAPAGLRELGAAAAERTLDALRGAKVLAIAGVGDATAFFDQLRAAGASVEEAAFADHHAFAAADASALALRARSADLAVCTLKDAVKLGPLWPRAGSALLYVSQRVELESGSGAVEQILGAVLAARPSVFPQTVG